MGMNWIVSFIIFGIVLLLFLFLLYRSQQKNKRLQSAINSASLELQKVQTAFQRFVPQKVVEQIIDQGISVHGERSEATILFADIIGFVEIAEQMEPELLVKVLNGYFEVMSQAITAHRGHVSKFLGDGLMALFGTPNPNRWHCLDAVWAALAMRKALVEYNQSLQAKNLPALTIGIGIHTGPVVAGVLGNKQLMEFTVIGDVVNTASRIETLTRQYQADILISREVRQNLDDRFRVRELPPVEVKGKSRKLSLFVVEGYGENGSGGAT